MAGKSTINISVEVDADGKGFKVLANSADGLKTVMQATATECEQLKKSLVNWSQGIQAISAITDMVGRASSAVSAFSDKMKSAQQENIAVTQLTGKTGDEMLHLRNSIKAVSDHFGTDFKDTLQGVNALTKGFGISAEEAMQLVKDGFVSGANAQGDFVDTLKEYPRYFKEAGLSAEDFIAITVNAAKQGIYSDKGVDVIKEGNLRIREMTAATAAAMEGIGISAEKVQADLQSGSITTFDVMQMVAAKLSELPASSAAVGTAIADIFGGPGEDAGLEYIQSLANVQLNMDAVKAAAGETALQQEGLIQTQENLKNSMSGLIDLSGLYTNIAPYAELAAQVAITATGIGSFIKTLQAMNLALIKNKAAALASAAAQKIVSAATLAWTAVQKILNVVLSANPVGIVIAAIGALVAIVITAYNNCEGFRQIVDKVWEALKPLANAIMNGLAKAFEWLVEKCKEAWEWLKNILGLGNKKVEVAVDVSKPKTAAPTLDMGNYKSTGSGGSAVAKTPKAANPVWTENASTLKEITDNIQVLNNKLQTASIEQAAEINKEIAYWEKKAEAIQNAGKEVDDLAEKTDNLTIVNEKEANLKEYEENIQALNNQLQKASLERAAEINKEREHWQQLADKIKEVGKQTAVNESASTLKEIGGNIQFLTEELQTATVEEAALINQQIKAWNDKAEAIKNAGKEAEKTAVSVGKSLNDGWGGIKNIGSSVDGITSALEGNGNAWQTVTGIVDGFIGLYQGFQTVIQIISALTGVTNMLTAAKQGEAVATTTATTAAVTGAAAEAAASATSATAKGVETTANVAAAASGAMAAHSSIPFVGIALGLAAVAAIIAVMASLPKFAKGGVVSGPTLAMVGEYAGASGNPEVIAPLDKLRGMLADKGGTVDFSKVRFEIKGRKLVGILEKENDHMRRS